MKLENLNLADLKSLSDILEENKNYAEEISDTNNLDDYIENLLQKQIIVREEINKRIETIFN